EWPPRPCAPPRRAGRSGSRRGAAASRRSRWGGRRPPRRCGAGASRAQRKAGPQGGAEVLVADNAETPAAALDLAPGGREAETLGAAPVAAAVVLHDDLHAGDLDAERHH